MSFDFKTFTFLVQTCGLIFLIVCVNLSHSESLYVGFKYGKERISLDIF